MRITPQQQQFLCSYWQNKDKSSLVYLFGSRVDNTKRGGDIDVLLLTDKKLPHTELYKMKLSFYALFGEQKIDIVNFAKNDNDIFKDHILSYAELLNS